MLQHVVSGGSCEVYDSNDEGQAGQFRALPSKQWYNDNGIELDTSIEMELAEMNDGYDAWSRRAHGRKKFSTIANWIEKNIQTTD